MGGNHVDVAKVFLMFLCLAIFALICLIVFAKIFMTGQGLNSLFGC